MMGYNDEFKVSLNQKLRSLFLMLIGIYNSATILSVNNNLRKSILKLALESRLLDVIGQAELENEIQKTVIKITQDNKSLRTETTQPMELDEIELKNVDFLLWEVKRKVNIKQSCIDNPAVGFTCPLLNPPKSICRL